MAGRPRDKALKKPKFETTSGGGNPCTIPMRLGKSKQAIRNKSKFKTYPPFAAGSKKPNNLQGNP